MNTWAEIKSIWNCSNLILYILTAVILVRQTGYVLCALYAMKPVWEGLSQKHNQPPPSLFSPFFPLLLPSPFPLLSPPPIHNPVKNFGEGRHT